MAGGADVILIPEQPLTVERCCELIKRRHDRGKDFSIVVVSEGWQLQFESGDSRVVAGGTPMPLVTRGLGGIGGLLAAEIEAAPGSRRASPRSAMSSEAAPPPHTIGFWPHRFGLKAADLVLEGKFGMMASLRGDENHGGADRGRRGGTEDRAGGALPAGGGLFLGSGAPGSTLRAVWIG